MLQAFNAAQAAAHRANFASYEAARRIIADIAEPTADDWQSFGQAADAFAAEQDRLGGMSEPPAGADDYRAGIEGDAADLIERILRTAAWHSGRAEQRRLGPEQRGRLDGVVDACEAVGEAIEAGDDAVVRQTMTALSEATVGARIAAEREAHRVSQTSACGRESHAYDQVFEIDDGPLRRLWHDLAAIIEARRLALSGELGWADARIRSLATLHRADPVPNDAESAA